MIKHTTTALRSIRLCLSRRAHPLSPLLALVLVLAIALATAVPIDAADDDGRSRRSRRERKGSGDADFHARRLLKKAQDFLLAGENERGIKMLHTIIDQYPKSFVRYQAWLALGKHYLDVRREADGIRALAKINEL